MSQKKANILVILADQQRYDTINGAGYEHMITPNLDKLVEEGCLYTNAHSHNPVCMPARHDLLLGMPAGAHGYFANRGGAPIKDYSIPTLPRILTENGYRTAAIGKMHFSPTRMHHGYSEMHLMEEIPKIRENDAYAMHLKKEGLSDVMNLHGVRPLIYHTPQKAQVDMAHYETTWLKNRTIDWIDENGDHPFMLCVGYIKPHPPWDIPEEYEGIYSDKDLPTAIDRSRLFPVDSQENLWYGDKDSQAMRRKEREAYYTAITMVDDSVGEIIEHLRQSGQLDNTLVIYTSDHGEMLQDKGYYSKNLPYDSSVRVPFIVRYPQLFEAGSKSLDYVDLLDILPTCLDVANAPYSGDESALYGESLCTKEAKKDRESIIAANGFLGPRRWVMARNKEYKYIYWHNGGFEEAYDLVNDPKELVNIIEEIRGQQVYKELRQMVVDYEVKWGPKGSVDQGVLVDLEPELLDSWISSKYPLWMNSQFQKFFEGTGDVKGEIFASELKKAIDRPVTAGCETLKADVWLKEFDEHFKAYGNNKEIGLIR